MRISKRIPFLPHHDVLIERLCYDHERLVNEVDDPVLHRDVAPHDPGDDHPAGVRAVAHDGVGADHHQVGRGGGGEGLVLTVSCGKWVSVAG